jgi:hypothetical protein
MPALHAIDRVSSVDGSSRRAEVLMKSYRWITLVAALVITVCEILVFESQAAQTPQRQANAGGAATDAESGRHTAGVERWRMVKPRV